MRFDVRSDVREVERALGGMKKGVATVVTRAANKAIRSARTASVRAIAKDLPGVRQKRIRDMMTMRLARTTSWSAYIEPRDGRRIPISEFAARQTQRGVTYRTQEGRRLIPGAFLATMKSGHSGVFKRKGKRRLPIYETFGPSIPFVFIRARIQQPIDKAAREDWTREAYRQIELLRTQQGLR